MTKRLAATTGMLLAAVILILSFTEIASGSPPRFAYRIVNDYSGMVLMPAGGPTNWRRPIRQRPVDYGSHRQQWFLNDEPGDAFSFQNRRFDRWCIHPSNWLAVSGAHLNRGSCTSSTGARIWTLHHVMGRDGYTFKIRSEKSHLYMDIQGKSRRPDALAVQAPEDGTRSQIWHLEYVEV